ncbi:2-oxoacid:acceptor oxidoreductase family protein [Desulfurobacterium sp.]
MKYQIVLTGVGGQGTIFLVKLLARCALNKGISFIGTETHGMAQKGGTVTSYLKIGNFHAPLIGKGQADLLIGLYPTETLRFLDYLKESAFIVTNGDDSFPNLKNFNLIKVDASKKVVKGEINPKSLNIFILGVTLKYLKNFPFSAKEIEKGIEELNPEFAATNIKAFHKGLNS